LQSSGDNQQGGRVLLENSLLAIFVSSECCVVSATSLMTFFAYTGFDVSAYKSPPGSSLSSAVYSLDGDSDSENIPFCSSILLF
jgi:hypothetical protein